MALSKINAAWAIPENFLKETVDLETILVVIIERIRKVEKVWFEKKSDIKKAEPLPPIPKELSEDTLEIGIRFIPD